MEYYSVIKKNENFAIYSNMNLDGITGRQAIYDISCVCVCVCVCVCMHAKSHQLSDPLWPHGLQHTKPPCPSSTPGVYPNSCPLSLWCHSTISSSVVPFSSHLQSFPESGSFQMSQFFASGGQCIGVSASTSVLPMNIQDWFPFKMDWLDHLAV